MRDWQGAVRERLMTARSAPSQELVEEIAAHVADVQRAACFRGCSSVEAEQLAAAELARLDLVAAAAASRARREDRSHSTGRWANGIGGDLVHAWRVFRSRRGYSFLVVATLALGIGVCTAVFSLVHSLLLAPLPYPAPHRLVMLWESDVDDRSQRFIVSAPNYLDWQTELRSFAAMGIWEHLTFNVAAGGEPEQLRGLRVSSSLFATLGVAPTLGRVFTPEEDPPGHYVAVISTAVWKAHFAGDPHVIGRPIRLNGQPYTVIGVMPSGFEFPQRGIGIWTPIAFTQQDQERGSHSFYVVARLSDHVTFEQARDEIERFGAILRERHRENAGEGATLQRLEEFGVGDARRILTALSVAVGLVMLIACSNIASLQLAFGLSRRREFATRTALGARHAYLIRQVLIEALMLSVVGGVIGIGIAWFLTQRVDVLLHPGFRNVPMRGGVAIDFNERVVLFAVAISALSAATFAFTPLIAIGRRPAQLGLRTGDRGSTRLVSGTQRALVTVQIAVTIVVLCGAGLIVRSLMKLLDVNPGFDPREVLVMQVSLPQTDTYGPPERASFCHDLVREVGSTPGVLAASAISQLPLSGANAGRGLTIEGQPAPAPNQGPSASYRLICPHYFAAMRIPMLAGREFTLQDTRDSQRVVVVNRAFADRYWAAGDAVGKRLKLGASDSDNAWMTIVGVAESIRHFGLDAPPVREIFLPYSQAAWPVMTIVARTAGNPLLFQRGVRESLQRIEANLPAAGARSMEEVIAGSMAWRTTPARLLTAFGLAGLVLAALGVYGVLAYHVSQRTREFGVRLALGTPRRALVRLVLRQSAWPMLVGAALGVAGSLASGELFAALLYEVRPGDPGVLAATVAMLSAIALIASWLPARRAAAVDPIVALRDD